MSQLTTSLQLRQGEVFSYPSRTPWNAQVVEGTVWATSPGRGDLFFGPGESIVLESGFVLEACGGSALLTGPYAFQKRGRGVDTRMVTETIRRWVQGWLSGPHPVA